MNFPKISPSSLTLLWIVVSFSAVAFADDSPARAQVVTVSSSSTTDIAAEIQNLKYSRGDQYSFIKLDGLIPQACADSLNLDFSCNRINNRLTFNFIEKKADGLKCLDQHKSDCLHGESSTCLSLAAVAKDPARAGNFNVLFDPTEPAIPKGCADFKIETAKVSINSEGYDPQKYQSEANICDVCQANSAGNQEQIKKLQDDSKQVKQQLIDSSPAPASNISQNTPPPKPAQVVMDSEAMKAHAERVKERAIKKIKSMPCPSADDEDDDSPMPQGADMKSISASDPEFMDDIQDAVDAHSEKCQREAKQNRQNQQSMASSKSNASMSGSVSNGMNPMSTMTMMNGMNPMGGMYMMGGMNSMSAMNMAGTGMLPLLFPGYGSSSNYSSLYNSSSLYPNNYYQGGNPYLSTGALGSAYRVTPYSFSGTSLANRYSYPISR